MMSARGAIALLCLIAAGCGLTEDSGPERTFVDPIYTDHEHGFRLTLPVGWVSFRHGGPPFEKDMSFAADSTFGIYVGVEHDPRARDAEKFIEALIRLDSTYVREPDQVRQGITIHAAHKVYARNTPPIKERFIGFGRRGSTVLIFFADTAGTFDSRAEFPRIDSSLTFF